MALLEDLIRGRPQAPGLWIGTPRCPGDTDPLLGPKGQACICLQALTLHPFKTLSSLPGGPVPLKWLLSILCSLGNRQSAFCLCGLAFSEYFLSMRLVINMEPFVPDFFHLHKCFEVHPCCSI